MLLAVTMLPAAGIQSAFADEPVVRPAAVGGDVALEGFEGDGAAASAAVDASVAQRREDGTLVAGGFVYKTIDGGVALAGIDDESLEGALVVPEKLNDGSADLSVVGVDVAEGQVAEGVTGLTLPQSINNVNAATLAAAFPNLASIDIAAPKASAPVAAGAAAIRAAYSSFGGVLCKNAWIATNSDASQTTLTKELVWAPPATVVARIPAECASIAPGAFTDVKDLKTVVCFGVMEDIPQAQKAEDGTVTPSAFTDEQIQTVNVIVPQTGTVVPNGDHVSASVAVTDDSTMDIKREAWWKSGFASDRITLGEVYGSTTNTLPVTEEGVLETAEAEVAYAPETTQNSSSRKAGIEPPESAIPTPVPDDDQIDPSESGLVFTHLADMTLSVSWKGDPTATPAHLDIPAYATINGVTYPVTEIAPEAFKGAVFLMSITIPDTVKTIGEGAFEGCTNLAESELPSALRTMANATSVEASTLLDVSEENRTNHPTSSQAAYGAMDVNALNGEGEMDAISPYADPYTFRVFVPACPGLLGFTSSALSSDITVTTGNFSTDTAITIKGSYDRIGWSCSYGSVAELTKDLSVTLFCMGDNGDGTGASYRVGAARLTFILEPGYRLTDVRFVSSAMETAWYNGYVVVDRYTTGNFLCVVPVLDKDTVCQLIRYSGLEKATTGLTLPSMYVASDSTPSIPEPRREGCEFLGWTWDGNGTPNKDASGAFANGGEVTLTANWSTPASTYFYSNDSFKGDGSDQQSVVAVRITQDEGKMLSKLEIKDNDKAGLLDKDALGTTPMIWVNGTEEAPGAAQWRPWGGTFTNVGLTDVGDGWFGFFVGIQIPQSAVNRDSIVATYGGGDYIASLVTLEYTFA